MNDFSPLAKSLGYGKKILLFKKTKTKKITILTNILVFVILTFYTFIRYWGFQAVKLEQDRKCIK